MATVSTPKSMNTYGLSEQTGWQQCHYYLYWFAKVSHGEKKFFFWKRWVQELWPEPTFMWDEWCDLYFGALCGAAETVNKAMEFSDQYFGRTSKRIDPNTDRKWWREVSSTGAASTGKSSKAALWTLGNWLAAQPQTSCILTSTSLDQLKRRIWAELCEWIGKCKIKLPLKIVPSDTEIRHSDSDKRGAIFGVAVKSGGSEQEAVDRIKGIHNRRVFVVIDEATAVPRAISDACSNLNKGTLEFQLQLLGNALPGENQHTRHSEPDNGFESVTVDDQMWLTKMDGCCVHFDGHRSPALRDPKKFFFYIKKSEMEDDARKYGGENTPQYWTNDRGFWPPVGLSNAVMDIPMLNQFHASERAIWQQSYVISAAFDPAFEGGDRAVLYPFKRGVFTSGIHGIEFQAPIIVSVDISKDKRWIHYQLADAVQNLCQNYECDGKKQPIIGSEFIMDVTGEGGGLYSIMSGRWTPDILSCEFGGSAEKEQIHPDRPTTYFEEFSNKVTMLWYVLRRFIEGDQVRGLSDAETRTELTSREREPELKNGKIQIQSKRKMKLIGGKSPDKADACVIAAELLRRKGIIPAGTTGAMAVFSMDEWNKIAEKSTVESYDDSYSDVYA